MNKKIFESKLQNCRNIIKKIANEIDTAKFEMEKEQVNDTIKNIKIWK